MSNLKHHYGKKLFPVSSLCLKIYILGGIENILGLFRSCLNFVVVWLNEKDDEMGLDNHFIMTENLENLGFSSKLIKAC